MDTISITAIALLGALAGALITYKFMTMQKPGPKERAFIVKSTTGLLVLLAALLVTSELFFARHPNLTWAPSVAVAVICVVVVALKRKQAQIQKEEQSQPQGRT